MAGESGGKNSKHIGSPLGRNKSISRPKAAPFLEISRLWLLIGREQGDTSEASLILIFTGIFRGSLSDSRQNGSPESGGCLAMNFSNAKILSSGP